MELTGLFHCEYDLHLVFLIICVACGGRELNLDQYKQTNNLYFEQTETAPHKVWKYFESYRQNPQKS